MRLLAITDLHASSTAPAELPQRRGDLAGELLRRIVFDAEQRGGFDIVALLGDLVDDGAQPDAPEHWRRLCEVLRERCPDTPVLVVPGNHDVRAEAMLAAFDARAGLHEIGGYRFLVFADAYAEGDFCTRRESDRRLLRDASAESGGPIVALQHNPLFPEIDSSSYPYMLTNGPEVLRDYAEAKVALSLSGHYHAGQTPTEKDGVLYYTLPAACEAPFRYALLTLDGRSARVEEIRLSPQPEDTYFDCHAHTELAYCGTDITARDVIDRCRQMRLAGVCFTEHAPQLYCAAEEFWEARHIFQPSLWRKGDRRRMDGFRRLILPQRGDFVRAGLEVELDCDGCLTVRDEDRADLDHLVGAVHWLNVDATGLTDEQVHSAFLRNCEGLLAGGVNVLAHPWRYFRRTKRESPKYLYPRLAEMLAEHGAACEVNFHVNQPDEKFIAECIARGVKLALATDGHAMWETGALTPHVELVRRAAGREDIADLLYRPPTRQNTPAR